MSCVLVAVSIAHLTGPLLEFGGIDFYGGSTDSTRQMVVVNLLGAASIERLASVGHDGVNAAALDQILQLGVDRRQGDLPAAAQNQAMEILGAHETLDPFQDPRNLTALAGIAGDGHLIIVPSFGLLIGMILSSVIGMVPKKLLIPLAPILVLVFIAAVVLQSPTTGPGNFLIVSGVTQWGTLARQLVGPDATVVTLLSDPNADPHEHEATTSDALNVSRASIVVVNGAGYDTWLSQLVGARSTPVATINMAELMGVAPGSNPHIFYNPTASIRFVTRLTAMLEHRKGFSNISSRSAALLAPLNALQGSVKSIRASCAHVPVAATEDVVTYLLKDAGLSVVTPEALRLAIGNGVDPSINDLALALAQLKEHPAFLIDNIQTATPLTDEIVAQATLSHVPVIRVTETMTGTNYARWLGAVLAKIRVALIRQGCLT